MLKILLACATLFESKQLVSANELVRKIFGPIFIWFLRAVCGGKWVLRHSATESGQYNIFFSDYDLALLIDESWSDQDLEIALVTFKKIKSYLIMLGEVEVYFQHEWTEKQTLILNHGFVIQQVRDIRKLKWMKDRCRETNIPYHQAKALRAIKACRRKIRERNQKIQKSVDLVFEGCPVPFDKVYSEFFQTEILFNKTKTNQLLMALTTVDRSPYLPWSPMIQQHRQPAIRFEYLEHYAYQREQKSKISPRVDWLEQLNRELQILEAALKTDPTWIKRYNLHLNNKWVDQSSLKEIQQQEEQLEIVHCLETDTLFQAWMKINLPKVAVSVSKDSATNFVFTVEAKKNVVSYIGPISDKFGFDLFLQFVLYVEGLNQHEFSVEICSFCNAQQLVQQDIRFRAELEKIRSKVVFTLSPTGSVPLFYRCNYFLEQNWLIFAKNLGLKVVLNKDFDIARRIIFFETEL